MAGNIPPSVCSSSSLWIWLTKLQKFLKHFQKIVTDRDTGRWKPPVCDLARGNQWALSCPVHYKSYHRCGQQVLVIYWPAVQQFISLSLRLNNLVFQLSPYFLFVPLHSQSSPLQSWPWVLADFDHWSCRCGMNNRNSFLIVDLIWRGNKHCCLCVYLCNSALPVLLSVDMGPGVITSWINTGDQHMHRRQKKLLSFTPANYGLFFLFWLS